jgi:hypothetical protein
MAMDLWNWRGECKEHIHWSRGKQAERPIIPNGESELWGKMVNNSPTLGQRQIAKCCNCSYMEKAEEFIGFRLLFGLYNWNDKFVDSGH